MSKTGYLEGKINTEDGMPDIYYSEKIGESGDVKSLGRRVDGIYSSVSKKISESISKDLKENRDPGEMFDKIELYTQEEMDQMTRDQSGERKSKKFGMKACHIRTGEDSKKAILAVTPDADERIYAHEFGHEFFRKFSPEVVRKFDNEDYSSGLKLQDELCANYISGLVDEDDSNKGDEIGPEYASSRESVLNIIGDVKGLKGVKDVDEFTWPKDLKRKVEENTEDGEKLRGRPPSDLFQHYEEAFEDIMYTRKYRVSNVLAEEIVNGSSSLSPSEIFDSDNSEKIKKVYKQKEENIVNNIWGNFDEKG